jgi:hypothetical protein
MLADNYYQKDSDCSGIRSAESRFAGITGGVFMLDIIGEATGQERFRTGSYSSLAKKVVIVQEAEPMRENRLVEMLKQGEHAKSEGGADEPTRNRTKLDDGKIIIETYTEDGQLVKITPPGYLPFDKIA